VTRSRVDLSISSQSIIKLNVSEVCEIFSDTLLCIETCTHFGVILQCPPCVTDSVIWLSAVGSEEASLMNTLFQPWQTALSLPLCFILPFTLPTFLLCCQTAVYPQMQQC